MPCLQWSDNEIMVLKESHDYYYQVMGTLLLHLSVRNIPAYDATIYESSAPQTFGPDTSHINVTLRDQKIIKTVGDFRCFFQAWLLAWIQFGPQLIVMHMDVSMTRSQKLLKRTMQMIWRTQMVQFMKEFECEFCVV